MRRFCISILLTAVMALCCTPEDPVQPGVVGDGDKVTVTFKVRGMTQGPSTRALGETTELQSLHLAVFGSSLYLKEYVEATLTGSDDFTYHYKNSAGEEKTATVRQYSFTAKLTMSDSKRTIHFIGNGPSLLDFGLPTKVLPALLSEKETAFWAMIELENGIRGKRYEDGDNKGELMVDGEGHYIPEDDLVAAFSPTDALGNTGIPLVRNWAKIEIQANPESHFTPISFAVTNVPSQGTIVPYCSKGFIRDYYQKSFAELQDFGYLGNLPPSVGFDYTVPSAQDFTDGTNGVALCSDPDAAVYLYERPAPDNVIEPSFVIIYGLYKNPDDDSLTEEERTNGVMCFYKVDLMSGGEYYPIYRNFKYKVIVDKITARGHDNPVSAANSAGSADVSADVSASHLADISDGVRRLAIRHWMSKTFTKAEPQQHQISAIYYDDVTGDNPSPVTDEYNPMSYLLIPSDMGVISNVEIKDPGADGWRDIWFSVGSLDTPVPETPRTQTLRIIATSKTGTDKLWRDIVVTLQGVQDMQVSCRNPRLIRAKGQEQAVDISIPDGLPASMFPLIFMIEPEDMTLTPDISKPGNDLPVESGLSLSGSEKPSFHFLRTLTWEEYNGIAPKQDDDQAWWRSFSSYFKTNCMANATTVWVKDKGGYFKQSSDYFDNYMAFSNLKFTSPIPRQEDAVVSVSFQVAPEHDGNFETIMFRLKNLVPDGDWGVQDPATGRYSYTPTSENQALSFRTLTDDGDIEVHMNTEGDTYDPAILTPWHFSSFAFGAPRRITNDTGYMSNIALGRVNNAGGKRIMMGFYLSPDAPQDQLISLKNLVGVSLIGKEAQAPAALEATAQKYYVERRVSTIAGNNPVSVTLSSTGYVEETIGARRFAGDIRTYEMNTSNYLKPGYNPCFSTATPYVQFKKDNFTSRVEFDEITSVDSRGIVLGAGKTYKLTVSLPGITDKKHHIYYVQIGYAIDGSTGKPLAPLWAAPVTPTDENGARYAPYPGNNYQYEWHLPEETLSAELAIRAPNNNDVVINEMILKVFDIGSKAGFL